MYNVGLKNKLLEEVRKGRSIHKVSKEFGVSYSTAVRWCKDAAVRSVYTHDRVIRSDEEIIQLIKDRKVVRAKDINVNPSRLKRLCSEGKLKVKRIPKISARSPIKRYYRWYTNRDLYYVDEDDLLYWMLSKIDGSPKDLGVSIHHFLKGLGLECPGTRRFNSRIIDLFHSLGLPRSQAEVILYMLHVDWCTSLDIERETSLERSTIYFVLKKLGEKCLVEKTRLPRRGKGSAVYAYKLGVSLDNLFERIKEETPSRNNIMEDIEELRKLITLSILFKGGE